MRMGHCILTAVAIGLVPHRWRSARRIRGGLFYGSGDVTCVIRSIESAKWGPSRRMVSDNLRA